MSLGKIFIEGIYVNLKRLIFGSECRTDLQLREDALNGNIKPSPKVAKVECIGCGGCATVCPTQAIVMNPVEPVEIIPGIMKTAIPEINEIECVHCYQCHDFCPIYALFGVAATILLKRKEAQAAKDAQITENEENVAEKAAEEQ